jgi:hypothetical protein
MRSFQEHSLPGGKVLDRQVRGDTNFIDVQRSIHEQLDAETLKASLEEEFCSRICRRQDRKVLTGDV